MNEISFQAVQFLPRVFAFVALLALTWLISKLAKQMVLRATCECQTHLGIRKKMATIMANLAFWSIFVVMLPFIVNVAGFDAQWINKFQQVVAHIFVNWPLMMVLSLVAAGIAFLVRGVPRFFVQVKGSFETSQREA